MESGSAGAAQKTANLSDLTSASTARTNLGLGTAATQASSAFAPAGTVGGLIPVVYTSDAYPARPSVGIAPAGTVEYFGPTQPIDWLSGDVWTPSFLTTANLAAANPNFATNTAGWSTAGTAGTNLVGGGTLTRITADAPPVPGHIACGQIDTTASLQGAYFNLPGTFASGLPYTVAVFLKGNTACNVSGFLMDRTTPADVSGSNITLTTGWQRYSWTWTPSAARPTPVFSIRANGASSPRWFIGALQVTQTAAAITYGDS